MARYGFCTFDSGVRFDAPNTWKEFHMRDLRKWLENPFDDRGISIAELFAFTTDHLQRMTANNATGDFTQRIAATTPALAQVEQEFSADLAKLGLRKASKQAKDDFRVQLPKSIAKLAAGIDAKLGPASAIATECLPKGRGIFSHCTDDEVTGHLQTLVTGLTKYQTQLSADMVTEAAAVMANWTAIYGASESATGAKTATEETRRYARENLQLMLFLNLLKIAEVFARQPAKLELYMQQSLLLNKKTEKPEPEPPTPPA